MIEVEKERNATLLVVCLLLNEADDLEKELRQDAGRDALELARETFAYAVDLPLALLDLNGIRVELKHFAKDLPKMYKLSNVEVIQRRVWELSYQLMRITGKE